MSNLQFGNIIIETNKLCPIDLNSGVISPEGINRINTALMSWGIITPPANWDWRVTTPNNEENVIYDIRYMGSFSKRLQKYVNYYRPSNAFRLSSDKLGVIGSLVSQYSVKETECIIDFTNDFSWEAGDFGDSGSCFWGDRNGARELLEASGAFAIRFYDQNREGIGRAWIFPTIIDKQQVFIIFNGYGVPTIYATHIFTNFLGKTFSFQKIDLRNNSEYDRLIYINNGTGYLIASKDDIINQKFLLYYDMKIPCNEKCCDICGQHINDDNAYTEENDSNIYCEDCYYDTYTFCEDCQLNYMTEDMIYIHTTYNTLLVCQSCASEYKECNCCGNMVSSDNYTCVKDKIIICNQCEDKYCYK